jgi:hypothetical protein
MKRQMTKAAALIDKAIEIGLIEPVSDRQIKLTVLGAEMLLIMQALLSESEDADSHLSERKQ